MANWFGAWFGDSSPAAGGCDYPAVGDVQLSVIYGSGVYTGTLALPTAAQVQSGVGYGAGGTEFTGTLVVPTNDGGTGSSHSPANIVQQMLINLGLGSSPSAEGAWPISFTSEPSAGPDNRITVYDTQGSDFGSSMIDGEMWGTYGIQIRVRASTPEVGWTKASAIQEALATGVYLRQVSVGTAAYLVQCFGKIGDVISLGRDATSNRRIFTINAEVTLDTLPL